VTQITYHDTVYQHLCH